MDIREQMQSTTENELIKLSHDPKNPNKAKYAQEELDRRKIEKAENNANERLSKIEKHLVEIKKSHWTIVPTFWIVIIGTIAAIISIFL